MPGNVIDPPWDVISKWPPPNHENPVRRGFLTPYSITFCSVATILVLIRTGLRAMKQGGGLGLDDALMIPSWILSVAFTVTAVFGVEHGLNDRHSWDVHPSKYVLAWQIGFAQVLLFNIGVCCLKVSILLFFRRMVKGTYDKRWMYATWIAIAFTVAYTLVLSIALVAACQPVETYWMLYDSNWLSTHSYHCVSFVWFNTMAGGLGAVSDLYSCILPWMVMWNLQLPRRQKFGLNAIFGLGMITVLIACFRTKAMNDMSTNYDPAWYGYESLIWSVPEWHIGTICACLPSLRVLFRNYFNISAARSKFSVFNTSRSKSGNNSSRPVELQRTPSNDSHLPFASYAPTYKAEVHASVVDVTDPYQQQVRSPPPYDGDNRRYTGATYGMKRTDVKVNSSMV